MIRKRRNSIKVSAKDLDDLLKNAVQDYVHQADTYDHSNHKVSQMNIQGSNLVLSEFYIKAPLFLKKDDERQGNEDTFKYSLKKPFLWKLRHKKYIYEAQMLREDKGKLVFKHREIRPFQL
ncbi:hypothetical protein [Fusibacter sp. JL216-2]|uniref:hypothetical protein n=1 Tax=Fusibacter sp. JL216-2 TaxID=3071453 RepID=UPI003D34C430